MFSVNGDLPDLCVEKTSIVAIGPGLGLAMVHGIMHDHGGHIVVDTEKGKGAIFSLMFSLSIESIDKQNKND